MARCWTTGLRVSSMGWQRPIGVNAVSQVRRGYAGPVATDLTEQPMLDRVPLRTPGRIVAYGHRQPEAIANSDL